VDRGERSGSALTFTVGSERLAIAASSVAEVMRNPDLVRPPLAPPALAGVVNLRGRVVPVVATARLLGQGDGAGVGEQRVIVVEEDSPVGLLVDEVRALVPQAAVGTPEQPERMIDLPALLASGFGGRSGGARSRAVEPRRAEAVHAAEPTDAFFSFDVGGQEFALRLEEVREVLALPPEVARVPCTDEAMRGVMALRGRLLPLVNLDVLLGLGRGDGAGRVVVTRLGGTLVGLVVERMRAIVRVPRSQVDPVPPVLTRGDQEAQVQAVCRLDGGRRLVSVLSTEHLLRDGLAERLREQAPVDAGEVGETAVAATEQVLVFTLGDSRFGLPLGCVEEVARVPERLSRLPKAPAFIDGVTELRGRVVPVIDQARRFGLPGSGAGQRRIVVVRIGAALAGFVVDAVAGILRLAEGALQDSPELATGDTRTIHRIGLAEGGEMLFLLDPQELLDRAEQDLMAAMGKDLPSPS